MIVWIPSVYSLNGGLSRVRDDSASDCAFPLLASLNLPLCSISIKTRAITPVPTTLLIVTGTGERLLGHLPDVRSVACMWANIITGSVILLTNLSALSTR